MAGAANVASPDGRVTVDVNLTADGSPVYSVDFAGQRVIDDSRLGFSLVGEDALASDFELIGESRATFD